VAVALTQAQAAAARQSTAPVTLTSDGSTVGSATLTRTPSGIAFAVQTTALRAGDAVTIWVMAQNPDGGTAVLSGAGHVIGASGTAGFGGSVAVGDNSGYAMGDDDTTLEDALNATVTLVVRDHCAPRRPPSSSRFTPSTPATGPGRRVLYRQILLPLVVGRRDR
jgi:hypothetical protein